MSLPGTWRTLPTTVPMSAIGGKADIGGSLTMSANDP